MDVSVVDTVSADDCDVDLTMSDVPIDNPDVGASLPAAEEVRTTSTRHLSSSSTPDSTKRRNYVWWALGAVVLLAIVLGLALGLTASPSSSSAGSNNLKEPAARKAQFDDVLNYLATANVSTVEDMRNVNSPQNKAVTWLADLDDRNLAVPTHGISSAPGYAFVTRYVLAVVYFGLGGEAWDIQLEWLSGSDLCNWNALLTSYSDSGPPITFPAGALCDPNTRAIQGLLLGANNLKGTIPKELGSLTSLEYLVMFGNSLNGGLPLEVCKLSKLQVIMFSRCGLIGQIPPCLSDLTDMQSLVLSYNELHGDVPDLSRMSQLNYLALDNNAGLTGDVTNMFSNMTYLELLYLDDTSLFGHLDHNFLKTSLNVTEVDLSGCGFTGGFPSHLLALPALKVIDIHDNKFHGPLPDSIPSNTALIFLSMNQNKFNGTIPDAISNLESLFHLDVSNNYFTGTMPESVASLSGLQRLYLAVNNFTSGSIPSDYQHLTNLRELSLKTTSRTSTIPTFLGNLTRLTLLDLDDNDFNGTIPTELGDLTNLNFLLLNRNEDLWGELPDTFAQLTGLRAVFLDRTDLSGSVDVLCDLPTFNETPGDADGTEFLSADCGNTTSGGPEITCSCCLYCCVDGKDSTCHQDFDVPSLDPEWIIGYQRFSFDFGNTSYFQDRAYLGDKLP